MQDCKNCKYYQDLIENTNYEGEEPIFRNSKGLFDCAALPQGPDVELCEFLTGQNYIKALIKLSGFTEPTAPLTDYFEETVERRPIKD